VHPWSPPLPPPTEPLRPAWPSAPPAAAHGTLGTSHSRYTCDSVHAILATSKEDITPQVPHFVVVYVACPTLIELRLPPHSSALIEKCGVSRHNPVEVELRAMARRTHRSLLTAASVAAAVSGAAVSGHTGCQKQIQSVCPGWETNSTFCLQCVDRWARDADVYLCLATTPLGHECSLNSNLAKLTNCTKTQAENKCDNPPPSPGPSPTKPTPAGHSGCQKEILAVCPNWEADVAACIACVDKCVASHESPHPNGPERSKLTTAGACALLQEPRQAPGLYQGLG
jgi:hypothetical protein